MLLGGPGIVRAGRLHEAKIQIEPLFGFGGACSQALSGLFTNMSLFFKIQEAKWMIFED
jgi:hypothetical protein